MLHELDALEVYRIAELAADARQARERLIEKVPPTALGEPKPGRGPHNPAHDVMLDSVLASKPEFVALREGIVSLPRDILQSVWTVMEIGRERFAAGQWEQALAQASPLRDADIVAALMDEPDLHECLSRGLYVLGMVPPSSVT